MNSKTLFHQLRDKISLNEPEERNQLIYRLMEFILHIRMSDVLAGKEITLSSRESELLEQSISRLNANEPLQYITGEAEFFGRKFFVDPNVLIPRPETEELVSLVLADYKHYTGSITIVDIGTGSGCIAITLKAELPHALVYATDISEDALSVARKNASQLGIHVHFLKHDILNETLPVSGVTLLISNPPYIPMKEAGMLSKNVTDHEPHQALFVPDNDPLKFFRSIAEQANHVLVNGGRIYVEINEKLGAETAGIFNIRNFNEVLLVNDISSKARFIKVTR